MGTTLLGVAIFLIGLRGQWHALCMLRDARAERKGIEHDHDLDVREKMGRLIIARGDQRFALLAGAVYGMLMCAGLIVMMVPRNVVVLILATAVMVGGALGLLIMRKMREDRRLLVRAIVVKKPQ